MIAEVGGIVKVSGNKIAIPFAPPKPGSTPIITPRMMPISINMMLKGDIATAKPPNRALISSNVSSFFSNLYRDR